MPSPQIEDEEGMALTEYPGRDRAIGPVWLLEDAARALRVTVGELRAMIDRGEVVALSAENGELLVPLRALATLTPLAQPLPGLAQVVAVLPAGLDTYDIAVWLVTSVQGRSSHAERLRAGDVDGVVASARAWAAARASEGPRTQP